jgi:MFS family permease
MNDTTAFLFALLAFRGGFFVRPFGALVFGRIGDMVGRKYTFLVTIVIMGASTALVGVLPTYESIGITAPIIFIMLRLLQGLALGGQYGGAATYISEHAPEGRRGLYTSWIQTTATLGFFLSLLVILACRFALGPDQFDSWGWRIPFLLSTVLLLILVYIRLQLQESPEFQEIKAAGKLSKAPLTESFGEWANLKIVILALLGATCGQAVVWYGGQFYALLFLEKTLQVDSTSAQLVMAAALFIATPFFVVFGALSDQHRPQEDRARGLPDRGAHVFPDLQGPHAIRESGAGCGGDDGAGDGGRRSDDMQLPVRPRGQEAIHQCL